VCHFLPLFDSKQNKILLAVRKIHFNDKLWFQKRDKSSEVQQNSYISWRRMLTLLELETSFTFSITREIFDSQNKFHVALNGTNVIKLHHATLGIIFDDLGMM